MLDLPVYRAQKRLKINFHKKNKKQQKKQFSLLNNRMFKYFGSIR